MTTEPERLGGPGPFPNATVVGGVTALARALALAMITELQRAGVGVLQ